MKRTKANPNSESPWVTRLADLRPTTSRDFVRNIALDGISFFDSCFGQSLKKSSPRVQFLILHHVFNEEVVAFRKLLARLQQDYQFISYSDAVARTLDGRVDRPYLAFSFDDGQKCSLQAAEVLEEFGASACFFVCPPVIGETNRSVIETFCRTQLWHAPVEFMDWHDVQQLQDRGHEIGGHTMNHVNLSAATPAQVCDEVGQSFEALAKEAGAPAHFSWPYGHFRDFTKQAADAVFQSGYRSCASAERGSHAAGKSVADASQLCLYRDSIVASWPIAHVLYFLRRAARRPIFNEQTWPDEIAPTRSTTTNSNSIETPCELPLTPSPCDPAAA